MWAVGVLPAQFANNPVAVCSEPDEALLANGR